MNHPIKDGAYIYRITLILSSQSASLKNFYGMTPGRYIDSRRLKLAARELLAGEDSKEEILSKYHFSSMTSFARKFINYYGVTYRDYTEPEITLPETIPLYPDMEGQIRVRRVNLPAIRTALHPLTRYPEMTEVSDYPGLVTFWFTHEWTWDDQGYNLKSSGEVDRIFLYDVHLFEQKETANLPYPIGMVLEEIDPEQAEGDNSPQTKKGPTMPRVPKGYQERILQGGSYICFEPQFPCRSGHLLEIYQQMEAGIFLKWYYENQLIISTIKEKIIRYKDGKLSFYLPLEM